VCYYLVIHDQSDDSVIDYTVDYLSSETTVFTQVSAEARAQKGIGLSLPDHT